MKTKHLSQSLQQLLQKNNIQDPQPTFNELNTRFSFKNYVIGSHNQVAKAACDQIVYNSSPLYSPLFIYGGVGIGKTHLLQGLAHALKQNRPNCKVMYRTSEAFLNSFIVALKEQKLDAFRRNFRSVDVLIIDDIQFFSGKKSTTEEFYHTFNELHTQGKQIILASDRIPRKIPDLHKGLISRFQAGLIIGISQPTADTKFKIIQQKIKYGRLQLSDPLSKRIAERVDSNIRSIEGVLKKIQAYHHLVQDQISHSLIDKLLEPFQNRSKTNVLDQILKTISGHFNIDSSAIRSTQKNVSSQHLVIWPSIWPIVLRENLQKNWELTLVIVIRHQLL